MTAGGHTVPKTTNKKKETKEIVSVRNALCCSLFMFKVPEVRRCDAPSLVCIGVDPNRIQIK